MQLISEDVIDQVVEELESQPDAHEQGLEAMQQEQPVLLAYPFTENFEAFTVEEREYFLFLMLVVWKAVRKYREASVPVDENDLSEAEEANWAIIQSKGGSDFRSRLDPFFEGYPQEDLLAFAEDALTQDDEDTEALVSREGQEALFVSLKTVIDCLIGYKGVFPVKSK
ncbi:MAG: hypothetical protein RIC19_07570 [Phaeodactylibacter sp.]|uniref:hypothetical protein n=1 Tax=Phaeodactylibacter sp. TaxID=1940289 RepID=UPI0032EF32A5